MRLIAVYIDYQDWQKIEEILAVINLNKHVLTLIPNYRIVQRT